MSGFKIELEKKHYSPEGKPYPVWIASVNAPAYSDVFGKTPGEALHRLECEFDSELGTSPTGNWDDEIDLIDVIGPEDE